MITTSGMPIQDAVARLAGADMLLIAAGAGMSADSGIPTFRSDNGLWGDLPQLRHLPVRYGIGQLSNWKLFETDPRFAWGFYGWRLENARRLQPHSGYKVLLDIAQSMPRHQVFTSNVDGHFQRAGFDDSQVVEVHGSLHWLQGVDGRGCWPADDFVPQIDLEVMRHTGDLPRTILGGHTLARPAVWMLEDWAFNHTRPEAAKRRMFDEINEVVESGGRIAVIEIGAGTVIPTVHHFARRMGTFVHIRVDPDERPVPSMLQASAYFCQVTAGAEAGLQHIADILADLINT